MTEEFQPEPAPDAPAPDTPDTPPVEFTADDEPAPFIDVEVTAPAPDSEPQPEPDPIESSRADAETIETAPAGAETPVDSASENPFELDEPVEDEDPVTAETAPIPVPAPAATPQVPNFDFTLPNGTVGKAYSAELVYTPQRHCNFSSKSIEGLAELGLELDGWQVAGSPTTPGDHLLSVRFTLEEHEGETFEQPLTVSINPDPRSLWKELDPPEDAPHPKPHTACDRLVTPQGLLVTASRRGRSHAHEGTFRDDESHIGFDAATGWHLLVVADGAGSVPLSRRGSLLACDAVRDSFAKQASEHLGEAFLELVRQGEQTPGIMTALYHVLCTAAHEARQAITLDSDSQPEFEPKDYSTTLLIAIAHQLGDGYVCASFAIGDGMIGAVGGDAEHVLLNQPDSGEYAGQTQFLTSGEVWQDNTGKSLMARIKCKVVKDLRLLFAMTDGISDARFETEQKMSEPAAWTAFLEELHEAVELTPGSGETQHEQLLEWMNFWSQGNHDDRSLSLFATGEWQGGGHG